MKGGIVRRDDGDDDDDVIEIQIIVSMHGPASALTSPCFWNSHQRTLLMNINCPACFRTVIYRHD